MSDLSLAKSHVLQSTFKTPDSYRMMLHFVQMLPLWIKGAHASRGRARPHLLSRVHALQQCKATGMVVHKRAMYRKLYRAIQSYTRANTFVCLPEADKTGPFLFILVQCMASSTPSSNCPFNDRKLDFGDYVC